MYEEFETTVSEIRSEKERAEISMRIAICDDLQGERSKLISMLREYCIDRKMSVTFDEYESGEALLSTFFKGEFPLILLDIYMDGITGVETARKLKTVDPDCSIIFTTTSMEHGADAFDVEAFHYLIKPVNREKFFQVLDKWYDSLCEVKTIELKCGRTIRTVYLRDILYIDVQGRNSTVHTTEEKIITSMSLSAVENLLPSGHFCRPIRYCLAAFSHVRMITDEGVLLDNGELLAISRLEKEKLREQFASYKLHKLRRR